MLIDTHAHLYWNSFQEDFDQVIKRSLDAGVNTIINVGVDVQLSKIAAELNSDRINFYSTIGIHPHETSSFTQDDINKLEQIYLSNSSKVIAVGECGLDFNFEGFEGLEGLEGIEKEKQKQQQLFQAQIDLAKKLNLPLVVHCREAWNEVLAITKDCFGVYHCYSGLLNTTYKILNTNFLVSFAATITYPKNEYLREAARILPLEKMVLETDCPFLPPQSKRGQRNEPSTVKEIAQMIAGLKGISLDEVAHQTTKNVKIMFNLK